MGKVQGEGDYESARRYNEHTREDLKNMDPAKLRPAEATPAAEAEGDKARAEAKQHAKHGEQDARDAAVFKSMESKKRT